MCICLCKNCKYSTRIFTIYSKLWTNQSINQFILGTGWRWAIHETFLDLLQNINDANHAVLYQTSQKESDNNAQNCLKITANKRYRQCCGTTDHIRRRWMEQGFTSQSTQNRSFRRCSSQPISWLSTEKTKPDKTNNIKPKWSDLTQTHTK